MKKNFRKTLSLSLAIILCLSTFTSVFAIQDNTAVDYLRKYSRPANTKVIKERTNAMSFNITEGILMEDIYSAEDGADLLYLAGMFKGTGTNADGTPRYDLNRSATRTEALVMLIRMLGKEEEALAAELISPLTDVPNWASAYVGYAYYKGITKGVSEDKFGSDQIVTAQQYATFMMRCLALDEGTDYTFKTAISDFNALKGTRYTSEPSVFTRGDMVKMSLNTLALTNKSSNLALIQHIGKGELVKMEAEITAVSDLKTINYAKSEEGEEIKQKSITFYIDDQRDLMFDPSTMLLALTSASFAGPNAQRYLKAKDYWAKSISKISDPSYLSLKNYQTIIKIYSDEEDDWTFLFGTKESLNYIGVFPMSNQEFFSLLPQESDFFDLLVFKVD